MRPPKWDSGETWRTVLWTALLVAGTAIGWMARDAGLPFGATVDLVLVLTTIGHLGDYLRNRWTWRNAAIGGEG